MSENTYSKTSPSQKYPLPFFDLSQARMPKTITDIYKWCLYYYVSTPLIPAVVNKLSSYPVTKPLITHNDPDVKDKWEKLLIVDLNLQFFLSQLNLDWCLYGNSFAAVYMPFKRFVSCKECKLKLPMNGADWRIKFGNKGVTFKHKCLACDKIVDSDVYDQTSKRTKDINLIRYEPQHIKTIADVATGKTKYLWEIPKDYKAIIKSGDYPDMIENAPFEVLMAISQNKPMMLDSNNIFHMKRPNPSGAYNGLGLPLVTHALKWTYYLHVLQSAQEAIAEDKLVPTDFLFPDASRGTASSPSMTMNFATFQQKVKEGLAQKAKDPNHKILTPGPVGMARVGGDGRAMLLSQEIEWVSKQIIASMGVPVEFVYGGLTWTGSSITLRMLENSLTGMRDQGDRFLEFIVNHVHSSMGMPRVEAKLSELKMADDIQRQQMAINLAASRDISKTTLLNEMGYDIEAEAELKKSEYHIFMADMIRDTVSNATSQGEATVLSNNYNLRMQLIQEQQAAAMGQGQEQSQVDPLTGLPIDPNTGLPMDENGQYYDPQTGEPLTPEQAEEIMYAQQTEQQAQEPAGPQPTQGNTEGPGSAVDNEIYSQEEQAQEQQNAAARQAGNYANSPENVKQMVSYWSNRLLGMDYFTQQQILQQLQTEQPDIANLVRQAMQGAV